MPPVRLPIRPTQTTTAGRLECYEGFRGRLSGQASLPTGTTEIRLEDLEDLWVPVQVAQRERRMVHGIDDDVREFDSLPAHVLQPHPVAQEGAGRDGAERGDDLRAEQIKLPSKVPRAGSHLSDPGQPVPRRAILNDVGDVDLSARHAHFRERALEEAAGGAD